MIKVTDESALRDLVVVGASAGGLVVLTALLGQLPAGFPAAVLVVMHLGEGHPSQLDILLGRESNMPVAWARDRQTILPANVYLAPSGAHLVVTGQTLTLVRGPRENHSRPSINRLFRSAAAHAGSRTIGVLLTGMLDDGVAGLIAIRRCGGVVVVQDPADAPFPAMPNAAIESLVPDAVVPVSQMATTLEKLVQGPREASSIPDDITAEVELDLGGIGAPADLATLGPQTAVACPECGGPTWLVGGDTHRAYRCYLGHELSGRTLLADKSRDAERALWTALRSLEDQATALANLSSEARTTDRIAAATSLELHSARVRRRAHRVHQLILDFQNPLDEPTPGEE